LPNHPTKKTKKRKLLLTGAVLLFLLCVLASCTEPAPETRPTLYYQGQKYDLLHSEANKIDVGGFLIKQYGPIGMMRYPGEVLFEDLDASDARRVGDEVHVHPEKEDALIYHCEDCNQYFCITTEFVPLESVEEFPDPVNTNVGEGEPRPALYYNKRWHALDHYDGNHVDVAGRKLKQIGITRYASLKGTNDLDVAHAADAGYAVYIDKKQPDILIYHCDHCDEYFSISLD
jgi:hypothetical protein